jgi:hypothetical protein
MTKSLRCRPLTLCVHQVTGSPDGSVQSGIGNPDQSVPVGQLRPPRLPPQDRQLVPHQDDLEFLRAVTAPE